MGFFLKARAWWSRFPTNQSQNFCLSSQHSQLWIGGVVWHLYRLNMNVYVHVLLPLIWWCHYTSKNFALFATNRRKAATISCIALAHLVLGIMKRWRATTRSWATADEEGKVMKGWDRTAIRGAIASTLQRNQQHTTELFRPPTLRACILCLPYWLVTSSSLHIM